MWVREIFHAIEFNWYVPPLLRSYSVFMATLDLYADDQLLADKICD